MSTEENERLTNGTVLHTKAKGVPPIDKMVNTIPPRECHLTLKCVDGTTSKTSPSYDSKFNTTADQTRRWKENKTSLHHENVATTPGRIKSDDETADQTYYDPHLTCNITPPPQQHNDTTMSCPVPWKPRGFLQGLLTRLRSNEQNRKPPDPNTINYGLPRNRSGNTTIAPWNNDKKKPCSPRMRTQTDFLGELVRRAKLLLLSLMMIMELQMRIEQLHVIKFWISSSPPDCSQRQVNPRQTNINHWLISEGSQRYRRRNIYRP